MFRASKHDSTFQKTRFDIFLRKKETHSLKRKASSYGLVVKAKYSWLRGPGFKPPHYGDHFSGTIHLDQSMEQKICGKRKTLTWQCCICCKPANGWTLRHGWLIKSSTEWTVSLSANWDRSPKKVSRDKELVKVDSFLSYILCSLCFHWYKTLCFTVANH